MVSIYISYLADFPLSATVYFKNMEYMSNSLMTQILCKSNKS